MSAPGPVAHTRYQFVVRGELGDHFAEAFQGMRIKRVAGTTLINGSVVDQSHLLGVIERIQNLGLELISIGPETPTNG